MQQRKPSDSEMYAEFSPYNRTSDKWSKLNNMDVWTKDDVRKWLIKNKVPEEYAEILYAQDVYGAALIHFGKEELLKLVSKHGPAVHIYNIVAQFKISSKNSEKHRSLPRDTDVSVGTSAVQHFQQEKEVAESPSTGSAQLEIPTQISIEEKKDGISSVETWSVSSEDKPKYTGSGRKSPFQDENVLLLEEQNDGMCTKEDEASCAQSPALHLTQCTKQTINMRSETKASLIESKNPEDMSTSSVFHNCDPRPFDKSSETFEYIQNYILPPETGPSNLIDPLHEYKLMTNTENASEEDVLKKFRDETFWFAAACMNTRTNGTIHFGVGDKPLYKHGQIIGLEVPSRDKYVDEFDKGLKEHFKGKRNIAMTCIRPPKFVKVKCPDNKDKWVIEIDVVPKYKLTQNTFFYTTLDKKKKKSKCLFIRSGAHTINYLPENNPKILKQNKNFHKDVELWALARQLAEEDIASLR